MVRTMLTLAAKVRLCGMTHISRPPSFSLKFSPNFSAYTRVYTVLVLFQFSDCKRPAEFEASTFGSVSKRRRTIRTTASGQVLEYRRGMNYQQPAILEY